MLYRSLVSGWSRSTATSAFTSTAESCSAASAVSCVVEVSRRPRGRCRARSRGRRSGRTDPSSWSASARWSSVSCCSTWSASDSSWSSPWSTARCSGPVGVGSNQVARATTTTSSIATRPTAAIAPGRTAWARTAHTRSTRKPAAATTTNDTSSTPPTLATARAAGTACRATPTSAQGKPAERPSPLHGLGEHPRGRGQQRRRDAAACEQRHDQARRSASSAAITVTSATNARIPKKWIHGMTTE